MNPAPVAGAACGIYSSPSASRNDKTGENIRPRSNRSKKYMKATCFFRPQGDIPPHVCSATGRRHML